MKKIFAGVGLIVFLVAIIVLIYRYSGTHQQRIKITPPGPLPKEVTITLTKNGFSPDHITVKTNTSVRWSNELGENATVNSDDYPTNQLHKELNLGVFSNGSVITHIFTKPGSYGYHDQFHPSYKGTVSVEK